MQLKSLKKWVINYHHMMNHPDFDKTDLSNLRIIPRNKNRKLGQKITTVKRKKNGSYKK